jgi:hypothetical protein
LSCNNIRLGEEDKEKGVSVRNVIKLEKKKGGKGGRETLING